MPHQPHIKLDLTALKSVSGQTSDVYDDVRLGIRTKTYSDLVKYFLIQIIYFMSNPEFSKKPDKRIPGNNAEYNSAILNEFLFREYTRESIYDGIPPSNNPDVRQDEIKKIWAGSPDALIFEVRQSLHVIYDDKSPEDPNLNVFVYRNGLLVREEHYAQNGDYFYTIDAENDDSDNPVRLTLLHSDGYGLQAEIIRDTETNPFNGAVRKIRFIDEYVIKVRKITSNDGSTILEAIPGTEVLYQQVDRSDPETF